MLQDMKTTVHRPCSAATARILTLAVVAGSAMSPGIALAQVSIASANASPDNARAVASEVHATNLKNAEFKSAQEDDLAMKIGGLLQFRWIGNSRGDESGRPSGASPDDNTEAGFEFRRIELGFSGNVGDPRIGYQLVLATEDGSQGVEQIIAQDVVLKYEVSDTLTITAGRYFAPFLREELIGGGGSLPVALSYMNNNLSVGRGEGVSAIYQSGNIKFNAFLSDGAGSGGGGGVNSPWADNVDWAATARADYKVKGEWNQWGDFTSWRDESQAVFVGAAVHIQQGEDGNTAGSNDVDLFNWTVDGSYQNNGLHLYLAVAGSQVDTEGAGDVSNVGVIAQAGYLTSSSKFEPFVRYELMSFDDTLGFISDEVSIVTVGTNYHLNQSAKFGFDVLYALDPVPTDSANAGLLADGAEDGQVVLRAQFQLKF